METKRPNIVVVGGGSGASMLLRGLKKHPVDLTAIVTTFDSGGSSGILREEFGYPPFGDLRQCLVALSDSSGTSSLRTATEFRFSSESSLSGHSLGNLLLAALTSLHNDVEGAIAEMSRMLDIKDKVIPVALAPADLCAELEDGSHLRGESAIDLRRGILPRIQNVYLDPVVDANPRALEAIGRADAIVFGPGDLYTSIVPNLLARNMTQAVIRSKARKIYVCNLMTKQGETGNFSSCDFAREIVRYLDGLKLDTILVNTKAIPADAQARYADDGAEPVTYDEGSLAPYASSVLAMPLSFNYPKVRHDPDRLAEAVMSAAEMVRASSPSLEDEFERISGSKNAELGARLKIAISE